MLGRVIVVDEDMDWQQRLKAELEDAGYAVTQATSGQQAVKQVANMADIDLMILALHLPDGWGLDYLGRFVTTRPEMKIIINTAYPLAKMDFRSWGADAFVVKTEEMDGLKQTIMHVVPR